MQTVSLIILLLVVNALGKSDFEALLELKRGIDEDPSGQVLDSWNSKSLASDGCPQNWFGITCSDGHVTSIVLNDVGLVGNFSFPSIIGLKMLRNISVSNNQLTGTISSIGSIQSLEVLDLSRNIFRGFLPSGIVKLKNLVLLNLSSNGFEGTFPSGFGNLERLKYLDLRANTFNGDIMHIVSQLGGVVHLDLSSNQLSGSLDLGLGSNTFISAIQYLNISYNSLAGELFAHDGMPYFDNLEVFDGSNNQLVGNIPSFNFVVSLRILWLGSNQLSGSLPQALLQESSMMLSELDLSHNQLEETDRRKLPPLSINERLRVAVHVARCLNYLHNERAIPHGNLKSSNILLETPNMNALLTDYSLHRILTPAGTAAQVLNAGALGYRPPEFASSSKPLPSLKSDVYAFGVIMLELLTGKSCGEIVCGEPGVVDLIEWVRLLASENRSGECFDNLIMDRHNVEHPPRILEDMLQVALKCILPASERPDMKSVFDDLSTIVLEETSQGK